MACAGLKATEYEITLGESESINPTKRIINLGFDMMRSASQVTYGSDGKPLQIKIGIHYGPVIAGVIGFQKPQFSLIGDTINTTSRVCSTGKEGKITISEQAYCQVKDVGWTFVERPVEVK